MTPYTRRIKQMVDSTEVKEDSTDIFKDKILTAIGDAVKDTIEDEIQRAKDRLEKRLREQAAQVAINIAKWVDIQAVNDHIIITYKQG